MKELFANSAKEELIHLTDLLGSDGWLVYRRIVKWHKENLNQELLRKLDDLTSCSEPRLTRAGMRECDKLVELVKDRIKALEKEVKENGNN